MSHLFGFLVFFPTTLSYSSLPNSFPMPNKGRERGQATEKEENEERNWNSEAGWCRGSPISYPQVSSHHHKAATGHLSPQLFTMVQRKDKTKTTEVLSMGKKEERTRIWYLQFKILNVKGSLKKRKQSPGLLSKSGGWDSGISLLRVWVQSCRMVQNIKNLN